MAASAYPLRPSSAARWVKCPGSVRLCALVPDDEGPEAAEGTAAHWVAAEFMAGRFPALGTVAPNGIAVTQDMLDGAALFVATMASKVPPANALVEHPLRILDIHEGCGGTMDAGGLGFPPVPLIHVGDYKYGHGFVDAYENWQCIAYAFGLFEHLVSVGLLAPVDEMRALVEITVVQPRNYDRVGPVRTWRVPLVELRAHRNTLRHAAERAMSDNPPLRAGDHCEHCEARALCPALQDAAYRVADRAQIAIPHPLNATQLGAELRRLDAASAILNARVEALRAEALARLRRGEPVAFYAVEHPAGRLSWHAGSEADVIALGDALGKDLRAPPKPITPTQAKAAGVPAELVDAYASRPRGEAKLVPLDPSKPQRIFGATS